MSKQDSKSSSRGGGREKGGKSGGSGGDAPWRATRESRDDSLRVTLADLELNRDGMDLLDDVAREKRLPPIDTLLMEVDIAGITSREKPLITEAQLIQGRHDPTPLL